jgi:diguanylate cyclase (GGDEF)-like protein
VTIVAASSNGKRRQGPTTDEQTLAEREQTLADGDQIGSDVDQTAADSDQAASDSDQAASDRDLEEHGDAEQHDQTRDMRDRGTEQRRQASHKRMEAATGRDAVADARDAAAAARDRVATLRERNLAARDASWRVGKTAMKGQELLLRAAGDRRRAAADRAAAAEGRTRAAADREQAAADREQAAADRDQARVDRAELLDQLMIAETDALTGTRTRAAGLGDLDREVARARRTNAQLAVAYVDVVGLKAVNDDHGHAAGDALLQHAAGAIRAHLRSYDSMVRLGGDEFLCVMSGTTIEDARRRFRAVQTVLAAGFVQCEITVGFAALAEQDSAADLIERADTDLLTNRQSQPR